MKCDTQNPRPKMKSKASLRISPPRLADRQTDDETTSSILSPGSSAPDLVGVFLALRLGHVPGDDEEKECRDGREDEVDDALPEALVDHGEELGDDESGDPIRREGPGLRGTDGLGPYKLRGEDEGHGTQTEGEAGDEEEHADGREDGDGRADAQGEEHGGDSHAADGGEDAGFAAQDVDEGGKARGGDDVEDADEDVEQRRVALQQPCEQRHAVHDDAVDTAQLLGHHDNHDGHDRPVVRRRAQHPENPHRFKLGSSAATG